MVISNFGQLDTYIQEAKKSKLKLIDNLPFFDSKKCDSPSVSYIETMVHLFLGSNHATLFPL